VTRSDGFLCGRHRCISSMVVKGAICLISTGRSFPADIHARSPGRFSFGSASSVDDVPHAHVVGLGFGVGAIYCDGWTASPVHAATAVVKTDLVPGVKRVLDELALVAAEFVVSLLFEVLDVDAVYLVLPAANRVAVDVCDVALIGLQFDQVLNLID